jgi:hypothetical protein
MLTDAEFMMFKVVMSLLWGVGVTVVIVMNWRWTAARRTRDLAELERWRVTWQEYDRWLAEHADVSLVLRNMNQEVRGCESLNAGTASEDNGPWTVSGLRAVLRARAANLSRGTS